MRKIREYFDRYWKGELCATLAVILCVALVYRYKGGLVPAVLSATVVDPVVFYSVAYFRNRKHETHWYNGVKRLVMEHSGAGMLNALVVRPVLLAWFIVHLNVPWGTAVGKICADLIFYSVSAPMHAFSRRFIPGKSDNKRTSH